MRILVVAYKFGTEAEIGEHLGTYHYFIETLRRLVGFGHEVWVIAPWLSLIKKGSTDVDGVRVVRYLPPLSRIFRTWYLMATRHAVLNLIRKEQLDVVFVWQARETGYAISQIKDRLGAPFIFRQITTWQWHFARTPVEVYGKRWWYHKWLDPLLEIKLDKKMQQLYAKAIYQKADKLVFTSHAASEEAKTFGLPDEKIRVWGVAIETQVFRPLNSKPALRQKLGITAEKVVLFIGRINFAEKGIGVLLEAMPQILKPVPNAMLVIIGGGGESKRMKAMISDLNIHGRVQLVGKKTFLELVEYLNASNVMVVPSLWLETFGQVTIEAMACEVPVVTSDVGGSVEININGETGFVVARGDSAVLAQAVVRILQDPMLAERLGKAARKRVQENYSYEALVKKLLGILQEENP